MRLAAIIVTGALALLGACSPPAPKEEAAVAETGCPDDGPKLPGTGICQGRAIDYFDPADLEVGLKSEGLPEGCVWTVNETMVADGQEAILYRAMKCGETTTQLEFRGGARSFALGYVKSGFFKDIPADYEPVKVFPLAGVADPKAMIQDMARQTTENKKEAAACTIRLAGEPGYPADALVVDVTDAYKKANKIDPKEANSFCGMWGHSTESFTYWRIRGGYAWHFDLGQDTPDFDPASMLLMRKEAGGAYTVAQ